MNKKLSILMIGAHPDDCDFRCGGITNKYVKAGHKVTFLSMCDGSGGHYEQAPDVVRDRRRAETHKVEEIAGITYDVWDITDCQLIADLENRERLTRYIRRINPDIIFIHRTNDYHADHRNAAILVQDASYLLTVPNYCSDVPAIEMPVIMYFYDKFVNPVFIPDVVVPIDDVIEDKYKMFDCHVSQVYEWLASERGPVKDVPTDPAERFEWLHCPRVPRDGTVLTEADLDVKSPSNNTEYREAVAAVKYRDKLREKYGDKADSILFAEAFQASEYGSPLTEENKKIFFDFD